MQESRFQTRISLNKFFECPRKEKSILANEKRGVLQSHFPHLRQSGFSLPLLNLLYFLYFLPLSFDQKRLFSLTYAPFHFLFCPSGTKKGVHKYFVALLPYLAFFDSNVFGLFRSSPSGGINYDHNWVIIFLVLAEGPN